MRQFFALVFTILSSIYAVAATQPADSSISAVISSLQEPDDQADDNDQPADFAMLGAYRDFFSQAADFSLSMVRYRARGYDSRYSEFRWNGIRIEDWWRGTTSWNLIGPLTSIPNRNISYRGLTCAFRAGGESVGVSGAAGTSQVTTYPDEMRAGGRVAWSSSNRTYTNKATAGYNFATNRKGWGFAAEVNRRWGRSLSVDGMFADTWGFFGTVSKELGRNNSLNLTLLYAPSERGMQSASTEEAFSLTGTHLYNPNWGMQAGKERTARIRKSNQPMWILNHRVNLSENTVLRNSIAIRAGSESYSSLNWQNAENPYPDYYRNLPSFQTNPEAADRVAQLWRDDVNVRQIDYQDIYDRNRYDGPRAHYITEERIREVLEGTVQSSITSKLGNTTISGGVELFAGTTRNYKEVKDLMGGEYWLDIDQFVEYDDDYKEMTQNDLRNPNRQVKEGDRFGYDYSLDIQRASGWFGVSHKVKDFRLSASAAVTGVSYQRKGYYEKENFAGDRSLGKSPKSNHLDYTLKAEAEYRRGGKLRIATGISAQSLAPSAMNLFISPNYRNALIPNAENESIFSGEITAEYRTPVFRASATAYATVMKNRTQLMSFYDDIEHFYCNYLLEGIDTHYVGGEIYGEVLLADPLWLSVAAAFSDNKYDSSPKGTQWRETSGEEIRQETVYYKSLHTAGSPQAVGVVSLSYRPRGWVVNLSLNGFDNSYISPAPLRRTMRAASQAHSPEMISEMLSQEKFAGGITVDLFAGRSFYFRNSGSLGIYAGVNNIGNNKDIKSGGYEANRLRYQGTTPYRYLKPMDSKYYYALGINFFVNVTYRF